LRVGVVTVTAVAVVLALALNSGSIYRSLTSKKFTAVFTEAGGLRTGDEARVAGVAVGKVDSVELRGATVLVSFTVDQSGPIGTTTRAAIKTATALGNKYVALLPSGPGEMPSGSTIPVDRTSSPYDVQAILDELTRKTGAIDVPQLGRALSTLSDTFQDTPGPLQSALSGVSRISDTIAARDTELNTLLANANGVTKLLADRSGQITTLIDDGQQLLAELYRRRDTIRSLLGNVTFVLDQFHGLVNENQSQIGPALSQLQTTVDLLDRNDKNITATIEGLRTYAGSLGEAVGGGPWFYAFVPNLTATNLSQQTLPAILNSVRPGNQPATPGGPGPR
jgi:phospholipid/cholesterol/gamma-HCH transport system substrate-binding protein